MTATPPISYLALGDSYTIGEGATEGARWPVQLAHRLRAAGIALAKPEIIAKTGWTTDELSAAMDAASLAPPYGFVSLLIGVNNQYRGRDLDSYRREFAALLERAIALAGGRADRVLVLSIPDWGATPFGRECGRDLTKVSAELDAYNAANRSACERRGVAWVDVTTVSREQAGEAEYVTGDGLHPSAAMYREWAALALPVARRLLNDVCR